MTAAFTGGAHKTPGNDAPEPTAELPVDWRDLLRARLDGLAEAWRDPAAWTGEATVGGVTMPAELTAAVAADELVVHGWDLARATGQPYRPDPVLVQAALGFAEQFAGHRRRPVRPVGHVPADAPPFERLLGTPAAARTGRLARPQAVHQQVEQPAGLLALRRLAGRQGHAAQAGEHVGGRDVGAQRARPRARGAAAW